LILAYHSVSDQRSDGLSVSVPQFESQMAWLNRKGYRAITLGDFIRGAFDRRDRIVILTFDDGYADNYTVAFPVLAQFGFVGTIFLASNYIGTGRSYWWDEGKLAAAGDPGAFRPMSWAEAREMARAGFEFGSHTCSHPDRFAELPAAVQREEITRSRAEIEERLARPVVSFCYPRGSVNETTIELVEQAGYSCGVVTPPRPGIPLGRYTLRRVGVYRPNSPSVFRFKTQRLVRANWETLRWIRSRVAFRSEAVSLQGA
jgi:peptidoglycan/xylan/chitin deacetylase (PgdA/CDA1 family)